jgi:hypothetical protein
MDAQELANKIYPITERGACYMPSRDEIEIDIERHGFIKCKKAVGSQ